MKSGMTFDDSETWVVGHKRRRMPVQQGRRIVHAFLCSLVAAAILGLGLAGPTQHSAAREWNEELLEAIRNDLGAALLEQAILVPSNARWTSLTMGAAKAFWGWVVGWGRTI